MTYHENITLRGFAEAQANYDAGKYSPTTGKRSDRTVAHCRKGIWPAPVYEALCANGQIRRMSFWSRAGKPLDFATGRTMCATVIDSAGRELTSPIVLGCVHLGDETFNDPHFETAPVKVKPKRITAATIKLVLARVLDGDQSAVVEARQLLAA